MNQWTMRDYLRVLFRQQKIIITSTIIVTGIVIIGLMLNTKVYEAQVKMLVSGEKEVASLYYKQLFETDNNPESLTQIEIVTANPVLERAVKVLKLYDRPFDYEYKFASPLKRYLVEYFAHQHEKEMEQLPPEKQKLLRFRQALDALRKCIKVEPIKETNVFTIHVRDFDAQQAAILANVVSRSYVIFDLEQQLAELKLKYGPKHPIVLQLRDNIDEMTNNLSGKTLPDIESIGPASVKIIQQAEVPLKPTSQHRFLIVILAFLTGIFFGMVLSFIFEYMDQSIKSSGEAEDLLKLPILGNIPKILRWGMLVNSKFPQGYIKGLNSLADHISLLQTESGFKSMVLAGCHPKEGASSLAANLSLIASEYSGKNVLLLEANLRHPNFQKLFKVRREAGLADLLTGQKKLDEVVDEVKSGMSLITAGKTNLNPVLLLGSTRMNQLMDELKDRFDLIVIDAPPLADFQDGYLLSSLADKTLLVVSENRTRRQVAAKVVDAFGGLKEKILGVILNRRLYSIPNWLYQQL